CDKSRLSLDLMSQWGIEIAHYLSSLSPVEWLENERGVVVECTGVVVSSVISLLRMTLISAESASAVEYPSIHGALGHLGAGDVGSAPVELRVASGCDE
ncbi:hypothetical protein PFISCL1PPCAC_26639, partial [Pristionchus fissidentatus]